MKTYLMGFLLSFFLTNSFAATDATWQDSGNRLCAQLNQVSSAYEQGKIEKAQTQNTDAYFKKYDLQMEPAVRLNLGQQRVFAIEQQFKSIDKILQQKSNPENQAKIKSQTQDLCQAILQDAAVLDKAQVPQTLFATNTITSFSQVFTQAFFILLREGFEALLVVTALLSYLRRAGHQDKAKVIYQGVGVALIFSCFTAVLLNTVFKTAGASREALEGFTMLIAAVVLFYVSYWLFSKREAQRWQNYIQTKMNKALSSGSLFALGFAAFLAVYREGAETILFYQALIGTSTDKPLAISLGIGAAVIALAFLYWIMKTASIKIPYRFFFTVTAIFLYYMAFYFIGGAIIELQEAAWLPVTPITFLPQISWLGIYPTLQGILAQLLFLIPGLGVLIFVKWRQKSVIMA